MWSCSVCTFHNEDGQRECTVCQSPRGDLAEWACPVCTFVNQLANPVCAICNSTRPLRPPQSLSLDKSGSQGLPSSSAPTPVPAPAVAPPTAAVGAEDVDLDLREPVPAWRCAMCHTVNEAGAARCCLCESRPPVDRVQTPESVVPADHIAPLPISHSGPVPSIVVPAIAPISDLVAANWPCRACTYANLATAHVCAVCATPRPASALVSRVASTAGTVTRATRLSSQLMVLCAHCNARNHKDSQHCTSCARPLRPGGAAARIQTPIPVPAQSAPASPTSFTQAQLETTRQAIARLAETSPSSWVATLRSYLPAMQAMFAKASPLPNAGSLAVAFTTLIQSAPDADVEPICQVLANDALISAIAIWYVEQSNTLSVQVAQQWFDFLFNLMLATSVSSAASGHVARMLRAGILHADSNVTDAAAGAVEPFLGMRSHGGTWLCSIVVEAGLPLAIVQALAAPATSPATKRRIARTFGVIFSSDEIIRRLIGQSQWSDLLKSLHTQPDNIFSNLLVTLNAIAASEEFSPFLLNAMGPLVRRLGNPAFTCSGLDVLELASQQNVLDDALCQVDGVALTLAQAALSRMPVEPTEAVRILSIMHACLNIQGDFLASADVLQIVRQTADAAALVNSLRGLELIVRLYTDYPSDGYRRLFVSSKLVHTLLATLDGKEQCDAHTALVMLMQQVVEAGRDSVLEFARMDKLAEDVPVNGVQLLVNLLAREELQRSVWPVLAGMAAHCECPVHDRKLVDLLVEARLVSRCMTAIASDNAAIRLMPFKCLGAMISANPALLNDLLSADTFQQLVSHAVAKNLDLPTAICLSEIFLRIVGVTTAPGCTRPVMPLVQQGLLHALFRLICIQGDDIVRNKVQTPAAEALAALCQHKDCHAVLDSVGAVRAALFVAFGDDGRSFVPDPSYIPPESMNEDEYGFFHDDKTGVCNEPPPPFNPVGGAGAAAAASAAGGAGVEETKGGETKDAVGEEETKAAPTGDMWTGATNWLTQPNQMHIRVHVATSLAELFKHSGALLLRDTRAAFCLHAIRGFKFASATALLEPAAVIVFRMSPHITAKTEPVAVVLGDLIAACLNCDAAAAASVVERATHSLAALCVDKDSAALLEAHVGMHLQRLLPEIRNFDAAVQPRMYLAVARALGCMARQNRHSGLLGLPELDEIPVDTDARRALEEEQGTIAEAQAEEDRINHDKVYTRMRIYRNKFHQDDQNRRETELAQFTSSKYEHYELHNIIGQGATGITYRATIKVVGGSPFSTKLQGTQVAVKRITDLGQLSNPETFEENRRMLEEEVRLAKLFGHPFVLRSMVSFVGPVFQPSEAEAGIGSKTTVYIVMDLAPQNLRSRLARQPKLSERDMLIMLLQIMHAVERLHRTGHAHRDIKDDNVVLTHLGDAQLIDFDASSTFKVDRHHAGGYPGGQPPEVLRALVVRSHVCACGVVRHASRLQDNKEELDYTAGDVWAIGCMAYTMAGQPHPFDNVDLGRSTECKVPDIPGYPLLQSFANQTLIFDPAHRPTAAEAALILGRLLWPAPPGMDKLPYLYSLLTRVARETVDFVRAGVESTYISMEQQLQVEYILAELRLEDPHVSATWKAREMHDLSPYP